ncbi:hypothetical protein EV424DRAFT_1474165 [Suillus variegatus]|nr:hypothetical protein EV424DRAFT_1474165 [Suillus variegatus]
MEAVVEDSEEELAAEDEEGEIRRLSKDWTAPVYAFFRSAPTHKTQGVRRYLDTGDAKSMGNMHKHAKKCWGAETVESADKAKNATEVCGTTVKGILDPQTITVAFECKGKGKVTFSHRQHMKTESQAEIVRWVAESKRPFQISLMKMGRLEYYIPSPTTVSHNVKKRIANMLQEYEGALSFATDAWTSPNHRAFVAVTVHFEQDGELVCLILDVVEVAIMLKMQHYFSLVPLPVLWL